MLEKSRGDVEAGEMGGAGEVVGVGCTEVTAAVDVLVTCGGGATASMSRDVGVCVNAGEEIDVKVLNV